MKIYLAGPFRPKKSQIRKNTETIKEILVNKGFEVYCPWEYSIPHAWDYPNDEWGLMVFANDIQAINSCDLVVMIDYGREDTTAGTNWEAGYAFGIGKKIIRVEMNDKPVSLMVANGSYSTLDSAESLKKYDFNNLVSLRTYKEQK